MRLPLATDITSRDGSLSKDSLMKNTISEKLGEIVEVFRRPGLLQSYDLGEGQGQGMVSWKGTFFTVKDGVLTQGPTTDQVPDGAIWSLVNTISTGGTITSDVEYAYNSSSDITYGINAISSTYYHITQTGVTTGSLTGAALSRRNFATCWFLNKLWLFGGSDTSTGQDSAVYSSNDGISFSAGTSGAWSARDRLSAIVFGSYLYVVGGRSGVSTFLNDVWRTTDGINWFSVTMPVGFLGRADAKLMVLDSTLYIVGGYEIGDVGRNDVWSSPDGTTWTQVASGQTFGTTITNQALSGVTQRILLSTTSGVLRSKTGASWTLATASPAFTAATPMFAKTVSGTIYMLKPNGSSFEWWAATNNDIGGDLYTLSGATSLPISFSQTSGAASTEYLVLKTTNKAWVLTFGQPGTLTQITDTDYPANTVPGIVFLDGYFFVMNQSGEIYNSTLEDPLSWGALDFLSAEIEPDTAVAIAKHQNYIVAFKDTTTELFYDAGNPAGTPLARLSNAAIQVGCANGYSIASLDGGLFFISKYRSNQKSVHYFPEQAIQPVEVANESIKRILTSANTDTINCFACRISGHSFYVVNLVTEGITLVYDLMSQVWSQWTFSTVKSPVTITSLQQSNGIATATATGHGFSDGDPVTISGATPDGYNGDKNITYVDADTFSYLVDPTLSSTTTGTVTATGWTEGYFPFGFYTNANGKDYVQHESSGKIYEISGEFDTDNNAPIDMTCRTLPLNQGSIERKRMNRLTLSGHNTVGTMLVRVSDDDYQSYSKYRGIDLSSSNKQVRRLGDYRERILDFRYTGSNAIRIHSIDIE